MAILSPASARRYFGPPSTINTAAVGAWSVFAADVDGDGDLDVLSTPYWDRTIVWYENLNDTPPPSTVPFARQTPANSPTTADTLVFRVTFSEDVRGVAAGDFAASGTTAGPSVTPVSGSVYEVTVAPDSDGLLTVSVATNAAMDEAGNGNTADSASVAFDGTPEVESVVINAGLSGSAAQRSMLRNVTVTFDMVVGDLWPAGGAGRLQRYLRLRWQRRRGWYRSGLVPRPEKRNNVVQLTSITTNI